MGPLKSGPSTGGRWRTRFLTSGSRRGTLAGLGRSSSAGAVCFALALTVGSGPLEAKLLQEPPDTVPTVRQLDSTLLKVQARLKTLARAPGLDSTWFLPDSLLPDSVRELRESLRSGRRGPSLPSRLPPPSSLPPSGEDSIRVELQRLEGYSLTEYEAAGAQFDTGNRRLMLVGAPEIRPRLVREGEQLTADSALVYSEETGRIWTVGSEALYQPKAGEPVRSRLLVFDLNENRGTALDAHTRYTSGAEWILHGDLTSVSEGALYGNYLRFTSCELEEPHYHFAAREVKIVAGKLLVARPVVLYFYDVPVAWLPFMAQSMERGRASGILTPVFSINDIVRTSRGYRRRVSNLGFYWAMSDYTDATAFLDWWSGEHLSLTGSLRYQWNRQFLSGGLNVRQFWREEGGSELAFDASNNWQPTERTTLRFQARYASSSSFVTRNSFDPLEVVQSIDSDGGLTHRFSFGNLSLSANRRQYLSSDRVDMTLPNLSFSLSPRTFFKAPPTGARFYNNLTWSGSANFRRSLSDRPPQPDTAAFSRSKADQVSTEGGLNTSLTLGNLSLSGGFRFQESVLKGVPVPPEGSEQGWSSALPPVRRDLGEGDLQWNLSLGYQQRLVGSTTLTPSVGVSGQLRRSDEEPLAQDFVAAPRRVSLGVSLKTDLYGFFPGFGPFDAVRHKVSPSFDFSYSPKVQPTPTQETVFGARVVGAQRTLGFGLNQTFEARLKSEAAEERARAMSRARSDSLARQADSLRMRADSLARNPLMDPTGSLADSLRRVADSLELEVSAPDTARVAQARQEAAKITLLALNTTAVTYDFERAKEDGSWLRGFTTTQISNNIQSDYLRGMSVNVTHDLFEDERGLPGGGTGGGAPRRRFAPHLSQANVAFSLDARSGIVRLLQGFLGVGEGGRAAATGSQAPGPPPGGEAELGVSRSLSDESSVIPGGDPGRPGPRRTPGGSGSQNWQANLSYSLQRPRNEAFPSHQMIQGSLNFNATENWSVSWRTGYDLSRQAFSDHIVRLTRNLHRWQAYFDFRQTATGNWSFRFEVSLTDQPDLHFDYQQRSVNEQGGGRRF